MYLLRKEHCNVNVLDLQFFFVMCLFQNIICFYLKQQPVDLLSQLLDVRVHGLHVAVSRHGAHENVFVHRTPATQTHQSDARTQSHLMPS